MPKPRAVRCVCVSAAHAGYAFAYGKCGQNGFVGAWNFFSANASEDTDAYWAAWFFVSP